jgi:hypothetical protein
MIIGLTGHKQVGKDTVARIIQFLTTVRENAVGFNEAFLQQAIFGEAEYVVKDSSWQIKKFAYAVKQICSILTGIPIEDFEKEEVKNSYLEEEWWYYGFSGEFIPYLPHISNAKEWKNVLVKPTIRELMQKVGTDAMRDNVHTDVWVNTLMRQYIRELDNGYTGDNTGWLGNYPNWIISDVRFPNECKAIKDRKGTIVKVDDSKRLIGNVHDELGIITKGAWRAASVGLDHISETALDNYEPDYTIDNSGTIEELIDKVKEMLIHFKLL